jgi:hypothetical protein
VQVSSESALRIGESIRRMADTQLAQMRRELEQERAAGNARRVERLERAIAALEAERPAMDEGAAALRRQAGAPAQ